MDRPPAWPLPPLPDAALLNQHAAEVESVITHYHCTKLYYSQFSWVEMTWERRKECHQPRPRD